MRKLRIFLQHMLEGTHALRQPLGIIHPVGPDHQRLTCHAALDSCRRILRGPALQERIDLVWIDPDRERLDTGLTSWHLSKRSADKRGATGALGTDSRDGRHGLEAE